MNTRCKLFFATLPGPPTWLKRRIWRLRGWRMLFRVGRWKRV